MILLILRQCQHIKCAIAFSRAIHDYRKIAEMKTKGINSKQVTWLEYVICATMLYAHIYFSNMMLDKY